MSHTLTRVLTAVALLSIAAGAAYSGLQNFIYLTHLMVLLLQIELSFLLFKGTYSRLIFPFVLISFLTTLVLNYFAIQFFPLFLLVVVLSISILMISYANLEIGKLYNLITTFILGYIYAGILPALTTKILMLHQGVSWFLVALAVVFSGDVAAYFVGRKFGKTKLIPSISPNKSWEGAIGGLAASALVGLICGKYLLPNVHILILFAAAVLASLLAQAGDFFESLIKRISGHKDSGFLLPGHGGFLDRFDGILFAIPVYYYLAF